VPGEAVFGGLAGGRGGEGAGEPGLVPGGGDDPGPPAGGGLAQRRPGPAELLLEEPETVLDVEAAEAAPSARTSCFRK
jgi:hypothetical protein